jgi:hypothetical protein
MSIKKYMTWFLLKCKYDEAKFEYDVFCNLSPYEFLILDIMMVMFHLIII